MVSNFIYNIKSMNDLPHIEFNAYVIPRSPVSKIDGVRNGALVIRVKAAPEGGKANEEVRRCVADSLKIPLRKVLIMKGFASRHKLVAVPQECESLLLGVIGQA